MRTFLRTTIVFVALMLISKAALADWKNSFYTDDSEYYLKLTNDGFKQLVRVHKNDCHQIDDITIKVNGHFQQQELPYQVQTSKLRTSSGWPDVYGLDKLQYCFFEVQVSNLNKYDLGSFTYAIKIIEKNGNQFYFQGLTNSVLPKDRIKAYIDEWIYLGGFGSSLLESGKGVFFKIWEPHAEKVFLTIDGQRIEMRPVATKNLQNQFHYAYVDTAKKGSKYFFEFQKNGRIETTEVSNNNNWSSIKVDPYAKRISYLRKGGSENGYIKPHSIVSNSKDYTWNNDQAVLNLSDTEYQNWIMYQLWPLTFNPKKVNGKYKPGTFKDIQEKTDYITSIGVNTVEFLPINESRFYSTWGYALDSLFLVASEYGNKKELKQLVDKLHGKKLKVIFDVVINHINNYLLREPLSKTVQTSKYYGGTTDWGPKPDFKNVMVQKWILDALLYLKREFHLDGFRFDMIKIVYQGSPEGYKFIQNFNRIFEMESPRFFSTAEELPDNVWSTYPQSQNGMAFHSQWNDKFKNAFERKFDFYRNDKKQVDLSELAAAIRGFSNHKTYGGEHFFGEPRRTVNYLGSHDFIGNKDPIIRLVSDYESYEWEGQNYFFKVRPLWETQDREQQLRLLHNDFTHAVARTAYGVLFTKPGNILFFQGEEVGNDINIENEWSYIDAQKNGTTPSRNVDVHKFVGSHKMLWEYVDIGNNSQTAFFTPKERKLFSGQKQFFKDFIKWRNKHPEINDSNPQYVDSLENGKVLSYHLKNGYSEFLVIVNFGDHLSKPWFYFPGDAKTWWHEIINSNSPRYSGLQNFYLNPISNRGGRHNQIRLAGPSISVFEKKTKASISHNLYLRGEFNNWTANNDSLLKKSSDHGDIYMSEIEVKADSNYRFKLATQDWNYEIGQSFNKFQSKVLKPGQGYLSSLPRQKDASIRLSAGRYRFIFDIKTFKFSFIRL